MAHEAVIFHDGLNTNRDATDYRREVVRVSAADKLRIKLSSGGDWAARAYPVR